MYSGSTSKKKCVFNLRAIYLLKTASFSGRKKWKRCGRSTATAKYRRKPKRSSSWLMLLLYLRRMFYIGPRPSSVLARDTKRIFRLFRSPFCRGVEGPLEFDSFVRIGYDIARNPHRFASGHSVHVLLVAAAKRLICNQEEGKSCG